MVKDDPTIGLYGIDGVYNYGCEAIVRGTEIILREIWPDVCIKYASLMPKDDEKRLKGSNVKIIPRQLNPLWHPSRMNGLLAQYSGLYLRNIYKEDLKWVDECDIIFSIGGDIYTLYPGFKDNNFKPYYNPLIHFGDLVKKKGKKLVIWGASIGPFENAPKTKKRFINHLNKVDLITSREPETTRYLKKVGIYKNVVECADPAFVVPSVNKLNYNNAKVCIGINLSPVYSIYASGEIYDTEKIIQQVNLITTIIKKFDAEIILIPHVICDFNVADDDLRYLKVIKENLPYDVTNKVNLIDQDMGFIGIKTVLNRCNVVIAARMHCAINALSLGIPTLFLAYSQKAVGMAQYVYKNDKFAIPLTNITNDSVIKHLEYVLLKENYFNNFLNKRIAEIKNDAYNPVNALKNLID